MAGTSSKLCSWRTALFFTTIGLLCLMANSEAARLKRAIMLDMGEKQSCISGSITDRNTSTTVILTGTVKKCDKMRPEKYSCRVQVWRIMKGRNVAGDLVQVREDTENPMKTMYKKSYVDIYGLGNRAFCDSEVKEDKTRIFFLNRVEDRLVLAASLLHITLKNLENTEKVIKGEVIVEPPPEVKDPCLYVLCGFGAECESSENGTTTCVCPKVTCGKSPESSDTFAPVCGSDGVTYPSECRLKAAQCWSQRRIRINSRRPCSPVEETDPCEGVRCGNSAKCISVDGVGKCQCLTCDEAMTKPVCGSDQISYRSECDLRRAACLSATKIRVVRREQCEPCNVYNETTGVFEQVCDGICTLDQDGIPQCCDSIPCESTDDHMMLCGSDGRTYMSRCALKRHTCKTGRDIKEVSVGSCPSGRESTVIRGSTSIAADEKCPGNCDESEPDFIAFKESFERNVNENLDVKNREDVDAKSLSEFRIEEVRRGSAVLTYRAVISWSDRPIGEEYTPGEDSFWAFQRLHDPAVGVFKAVITLMNVTLEAYKNPADDFIVEEVCGGEQCSHSASCKLSKDESGGFLHSCDCSVIGDSKRLPVTLGCKLASNDRFYDNKVAARHASCVTHSFLTFTDVCRDPPPSPCDYLNCEMGSSCIVTNGIPSCECVTCEEDFKPVCGSDDRTYRNLCELHRQNCLLGRSVTVKNAGMCASQCDEVYCGHGGQCEELPQGSALCICPSNCVDVNAPVCGSDNVTYINDCQMTISSCNKKTEITVLKRGACDGTVIFPTIIPTEEPEGSGDFDECGCQFGATCADSTIDDEDRQCTCNIVCHNTGVTICGSDGITYADECEMEKTQCEKQEPIHAKLLGKCPDHCSNTTFGCCEDGVTPAKGSMKAGCPETCQCDENGAFSPFCDHRTGQCVCRPGVTGLRCTECLPGFWNFQAIAEKRSVGCMSCQCENGGSVRDDCDKMTGQCSCKEGVTGIKCSQCENGQVLTQEGCKPTPDISSASSCDELSCKFGQECVEILAQVGRYECQCPPLSSCNTPLDGKVCASNGLTYADECQMRVIACRESKVVTVLADGSCEEYFESLEPVVPPTIPVTKPTTTVTTTVNTTTESTTKSTTTSSSTTTIKSTTSPAGMISKGEENQEKPEASGDDSDDEDLTDAPPDDEDSGESIEDGSGDENEMGATSEPDMPVTPGTVVSYKVRTTMVSVGDFDLVYSADLHTRDSEQFVEYSATVMTRIIALVQKIPLNGGLLLNTIRDFVILPPEDGAGITVEFDVDAMSTSPISHVEKFINDNLGDGESITFSDSAVRPIQPPTTESTYVEDGNWKVPQFGGSSYMEFPTMEAYSAATIHMKFKSSDSEGLLLYNGQAEGRDFISLAVVSGFVEFRFDTGSGQLSLRSTVPVNDGRWHEVVSRRNRREGMLKVDDEQEVIGSRSSSPTTGVNLDTNLFIGGFTDEIRDKVIKQTSVTKGLTGCIVNTKVGQHGKSELHLSSGGRGLLNSFRIAECTNSPCMPNPCEYSSKCFITYQLEEFTHKCYCGSKYYGDRCQHRTMKDTCASNPCHESSTCVEDDESYRCVCPESRSGVHCENLITELDPPTTTDPSYMPMFAGDSYIQRPALTGVNTQLDIEVVFYTFQHEGLIFYNAQNNDGTGDFIALNLRGGHLEFMYNLGEGTAVIRSLNQVSLNKWHVAKLSRVMRIGDLKLDDQRIIKGEAPNFHSQLNLEEPLYIGAVPEMVVLPRRSGISTGLMGAIQKFVVNGVTLPKSLVDEDSESYHVQAFNGHACYRLPCLNNGACIPNLGNYSCECKPGFTGRSCNEVENVEEESMVQDPQGAIYFDGNVKAEYVNSITRKVTSTKNNNVEFQLRTTAHEGLIFYDGKPSKRGDFIALALHHGLLHLVFDLGSGTTNVMSETLVNDGLWKHVKIIRNERSAQLQVDDNTPNTGLAPPFTKWLNTDGVLWLGGCDTEHMPARHRGLPKSFYKGFVGCMRRFHIDGNQLRLREDVLNRPGLTTCPNR